MDVLDLGVLVEAPLAALATQPGLLVAAERGAAVDQVVVVDPDGAGLDPARRGHGTIVVLAPDRGGEAVGTVIGDSDDIVGVLNAKEVVLDWTTAGSDWRAHIRPPLVLPETVGIEAALRAARAAGATLIVLADEYGGTAGIVSVFDIVEFLAGELPDEYEGQQADVRRLASGAYVFSGLTHLLAIETDLDVTLPKVDAHTIGGLVMELLGKVPENATDWQKVESFYDGVLEKITYKEGPDKGAAEALRDKEADCQGRSAVFIALCRANKIPARMVWVHGHCYPEFYMERAEGEGQWYPCESAGTRAFGEMPLARPILQKGDNFRVPERKEHLRYASDYITGVPTPGAGKPKVKYIRDQAQTQ